MDGNFLEAAILIAMPTAWKHWSSFDGVYTV